jgi:hypothetical protein
VKNGDRDEDERLYWRPEVDKHQLPPSDVLWAVHRHATDFFTKQGKGNFKFMDESALLAIGVLLEETMRESIGETGHLAFLEPEEERSEIEDEDVQGTVDDHDHDTEDPSVDYSVKARKVIPKGYTQDDFLTDEE